ncbi:MAG: substrate-binding domain-containing protein, partial [Phycisphaerae bacterium]|nr:substrate-binding domain-containing protein [Phycisphaerae bacterium]
RRKRDDLTPEQLAAMLRTRLRFYLPGSRLPTRVALARQYRVSTYVSRRAVELLGAEGLVRLGSPGGVYITAKAQTAGTIHTIHVLGRSDANMYFHEQLFLRELDRARAAFGMRLRTTILEEPVLTADLPDRLAGRDDPTQIGWVLLDVVPSPDVAAHWRSRAIPMVMVNEETDLGLHTVRPDCRQAIFRATEHLILLGHRRIAYAGGDTNLSWIARARYEGFQMAIRRHGLETQAESIDLYTRQLPHRVRPERIVEFLNRSDRPTALVVYSQKDGAEVLRACDAVGVAVPGQISIISGGVPRQDCPPQIIDRLTRFSEGPIAEQARLTVELFANYFNHHQPVHLIQPIEFIDRGSTAPPAMV